MLMNFLAAAAIADPKAEALKAPAPNAFFEPGSTIPVLAVVFFIASAFMIWMMIRAGKGKNYGD